MRYVVPNVTLPTGDVIKVGTTTTAGRYVYTFTLTNGQGRDISPRIGIPGLAFSIYAQLTSVKPIAAQEDWVRRVRQLAGEARWRYPGTNWSSLLELYMACLE